MKYFSDMIWDTTPVGDTILINPKYAFHLLITGTLMSSLDRVIIVDTSKETCDDPKIFKLPPKTKGVSDTSLYDPAKILQSPRTSGDAAFSIWENMQIRKARYQ